MVVIGVIDLLASAPSFLDPHEQSCARSASLLRIAPFSITGCVIVMSNAEG